jgi:hypothetical protein
VDDVLRTAHELAADYLRWLAERPVGAKADATDIASALRGSGWTPPQTQCTVWPGCGSGL